MKKYLTIALLCVISIGLISWGVIGHKTVATIAENHLTPKSKQMVKALLGNESVADVASWADQVLKEPEYKNTAPQHYLNVPLGLSYADFQKEVLAQTRDNVYIALLKNEEVLKAQTSTKEQRATALKFIVHFVGDLHQPMHVSRAEDKGGNTIQVQFDGQGTNLHSLWDSKLIGKDGKTFEQMSIDYDKAAPQQIKQWQSDDMMKWLFESYQISSKLYTEIEQNNKLDDAYYKSHIGIVHERIEMAGIRLAGLLNKIFASATYNYPQSIASTKGAKAPSMVNFGPQTSEAFKTIPVEDAAKHIGESVSIKAKVYSYKELANMTLVNLGAEYPNQLLTVVLKGDAKALSTQIDNKLLCVKGKLELYKGKPEMVVTDAGQIQIEPIVGSGGVKGGK
jgi:DNA-binding protein YbaB